MPPSSCSFPKLTRFFICLVMAVVKLCVLIDGTKRLCHIHGKMHKKAWIAADDIILVGLRDYQDDKADVILKYMPDEKRLPKGYREFPENTRLIEGGADDYIEFEDENIDKF